MYSMMQPQLNYGMNSYIPQIQPQIYPAQTYSAIPQYAPALPQAMPSYIP